LGKKWEQKKKKKKKEKIIASGKFKGYMAIKFGQKG
jgi:hypothetical protein